MNDFVRALPLIAIALFMLAFGAWIMHAGF